MKAAFSVFPTDWRIRSRVGCHRDGAPCPATLTTYDERREDPRIAGHVSPADEGAVYLDGANLHADDSGSPPLGVALTTPDDSRHPAQSGPSATFFEEGNLTKRREGQRCMTVPTLSCP